MNASNPTTGAALPFLEVLNKTVDVLLSCFGFLHGRDPTNPLVAREGCEVLPCCTNCCIGGEHVSQVRRNSVGSAGGDGRVAHGCIVANQAQKTKCLTSEHTKQNETPKR